MKLLLSAHFKKDFRKLPKQVQKKVEKKLRLLVDNPAHPSLRVKKMKGQPGRWPFWEARIDRFWRMSFQKIKSELRLARIGPHDKVLKKR